MKKVVVFHSYRHPVLAALAAATYVGRLTAPGPAVADHGARRGTNRTTGAVLQRVLRVPGMAGLLAGGRGRLVEVAGGVLYLDRPSRSAVFPRALREVARVAGVGDRAEVRRVDGPVTPSLRLGAGLWRLPAFRGVAAALLEAGVRTCLPSLAGAVPTVPPGSIGRPRGEAVAKAVAGARQPAGSRSPVVVYCCYGSSHTSVVAAAIHVGRLDPTSLPTRDTVLGLPRFDRVGRSELGRLFPAGRGPAGEEVYFAGFGPGRRLVHRAALDLLAAAEVPRGQVLLVDALSRADWLVRLGGTLSRGLGLVGVGRPLVAAGIRRVYPALADLVRSTQARVGRTPGGQGSEEGRR